MTTFWYCFITFTIVIGVFSFENDRNLVEKADRLLSCYLCNPTTHGNCEDVTSSAIETCLDEDQTCYTYTENDEIYRGCSGPQPCLQSTCRSCNQSDYCNDEIFDVTNPIDYSCIDCDSSIDEFCKNDYRLLQPKKCLNVNSFNVGCYLHIDENEVYRRGCASELTEPSFTECKDPENDFCKMCYEKDCNRRLNFQICKICDSETNPECIRGEAIEGRTCPLYHDSCLVYAVVNGRTVRGCRLSLTPSDEDVICPSDYCHECTSNNCNKTPFPYGRRSCHQCDVDVSELCSTNLTEIKNFINFCQTYDRNDFCYTYLNDLGNVTNRGCTSDNTDLSRECLSNVDEEESNCELCDTNNCNYDAYPIDYSCIDCDSSIDEYCKTDYRLLQPKKCLNVNSFNVGCYLHIDENEVYRRGCASELAEPSFTECKVPENDFCKICYEKDCNRRLNFQICKICDSETNPECIRGEAIEGKTCPIYDDSCLVYTVINGRTVRGCRLSLTPSDEDVICPSDYCHECTSNNCNKTPFPYGRRSCHQCDVNVSKLCSTNLTEIKNFINFCQTYDRNDFCYTYLNDLGDVTNRGCTSDNTDLSRECLSNVDEEESNCELCDTNNCNYDGKSSSSKLGRWLLKLQLLTIFLFYKN